VLWSSIGDHDIDGTCGPRLACLVGSHSALANGSCTLEPRWQQAVVHPSLPLRAPTRLNRAPGSRTEASSAVSGSAEAAARLPPRPEGRGRKAAAVGEQTGPLAREGRRELAKGTELLGRCSLRPCAAEPDETWLGAHFGLRVCGPEGSRGGLATERRGSGEWRPGGNGRRAKGIERCPAAREGKALKGETPMAPPARNKAGRGRGGVQGMQR
jgi:hypothetical protein